MSQAPHNLSTVSLQRWLMRFTTPGGFGFNGAVWNRVESADPPAVPGTGGGRSIPYSGFKAAVFQREGSVTYVLAFVGSDGADVPNWATNIGQGLGLGAAQYRQAINYAREAKVKYGDKRRWSTMRCLTGGVN